MICRPISAKTIIEKLKAALSVPRPFIAARSFFGPDRRGKDRPWRGQGRRRVSPRKILFPEEMDASPAGDS